MVRRTASDCKDTAPNVVVGSVVLGAGRKAVESFVEGLARYIDPSTQAVIYDIVGPISASSSKDLTQGDFEAPVQQSSPTWPQTSGSPPQGSAPLRCSPSAAKTSLLWQQPLPSKMSAAGFSTSASCAS